MKIHPKEKDSRLCKGLTLKEFKCKCIYHSCRATIVDPELVKCYRRFRELVNVKLTINSGYRCQYHNHDVNGKATSQHLLGRAIDISKKSINHLSDEEITHAAKISGFKFVKIYKSFIHLDVREK